MKLDEFLLVQFFVYGDSLVCIPDAPAGPQQMVVLFAAYALSNIYMAIRH